MTSQPPFTVSLFYSYSHTDSEHRTEMEKALTLLREQDAILIDWSDRQILSGQRISAKIKEKMADTDIFAFLLSSNFIASTECRQECQQAYQIATVRSPVALVPIILSDCSWKDMHGLSEFKAFPDDGKPIIDFPNTATAWQQVYCGIRDLIETLRNNFTIRDTFRKEMEQTDFLSQNHISLQSIYVFPRLSYYTTTAHGESREQTIGDEQQLLQGKYSLIHGEELSGKTALCRHLFLSLVAHATPVIYLDLDDAPRKATSNVFSDQYQRQFHGDYSLWQSQGDKVIILDNELRSNSV